MANAHLLRRIILLLASTVSFLYFWTINGYARPHQYNDFSCPGHYTPSISVNDTKAEPVKAHLPEGSVTLPDFAPSPFAYV